MNLYCRKCLVGRSGDVAGAKCQTEGCDGIIEDIRFEDQVDVLPEPITCGRRMGAHGPWNHTPGLDRWQKFKSNGNRVCSFCGSLHFDDFFEIVKAVANLPEAALYSKGARIEPSDKAYKIYVHQPGVRNAMEGGIKFYTHHLPTEALTAEQQAIYKKAVRATRARLEKYLATMAIPEPGEENRPVQ